MAQFKGTGKIIGGQSGIGFTMTVTDGQLDGSGVDKIRMKIYNKNNGSVIYDNQFGASDADLPVQAVGSNSTVVVNNSNTNATTANTSQKAEMEDGVREAAKELDVIAFPNPSPNNFTIIIKTNLAKEKVTMQVVDMYGRVIETRNVTANSSIRFGNNYNPGTYFVRITQGKGHKEIKLVKLSY
jgi:Secretion system C-terminal sorting domain